MNSFKIKKYKNWKLNEQVETSLALVKVTRVEQVSRLSEPIVKILNAQASLELESSQIYRAMACWLNKNGWPEATNYYMKSADEELNHYVKIYNYLFDKNSDGVVLPVNQVKLDYTDIVNIVEASLMHEMRISGQWNEIANAALELKDNDTYAMAQWFLKEQIEEEEKFRKKLEKIRLDMPKYEIDKLFS